MASPGSPSRCAVLVISLWLLSACGADDAATPDAGAAVDGGRVDGGDVDAALPNPDWQTAHCAERECWFVMQTEAGADDDACNGRHPEDLGTMDGSGKRDCPFASMKGPIRQVMNPPSGRSHSKTIFVGEGNYDVAPHGLHLWGDGSSAEQAVLLTTWRGEAVTLDGSCPATCTVDGPDGPVTLSPCCIRECPTCDASPLCEENPQSSTGCAVPIDNAERLFHVWGQWVRVEGFRMEGCFEDNVRVSFGATGEPLSIDPNRHIYLANNAIGGCDVNENIKGLRNGPGPIHGGPEWGPVHVIGNELFSMASQAVDATGVHGWLVEENWLHDAKRGASMFVDYDGGGVGFKNGSSNSLARNNWSQAGGGFILGGSSGSCVRDDGPPNDWGCFQRWEMRDGLLENNVAIDPAAAAPEGRNTRFGMAAYHCDDCRYYGNVLIGDLGSAALLISDECPGGRCPSHNPMLQPSRNLDLRRNYFRPGAGTPATGPFAILYEREVHGGGPSATGMSSASNLFCAPDGFSDESSPTASTIMFGHRDPSGQYTLDDFRTHIGDVGSAAFNRGGAESAACPEGPPPCVVGVDATTASWAGPTGCAECSCTLVLDDAEVPAGCDGTMPLSPDASAPGRHYAALRVDRAGGGTSCGASYHVAAPVVGAGCTIGVDAGTGAPVARWASTGVRCRLLADGGDDLGAVPCAGAMQIASLGSTGRHHLRLRVDDAPEGQTTCGVMFNL